VTLIGKSMRLEGPPPSHAFYDAVVVAVDAIRVVLKNPKGNLDRIDRATGRVVEFNRKLGWVPTGWTLHAADVEALARSDDDEDAGAQDLDRGEDLQLVQVESPGRRE
jgi:hypothetical protein